MEIIVMNYVIIEAIVLWLFLMSISSVTIRLTINSKTSKQKRINNTLKVFAHVQVIYQKVNKPKKERDSSSR